MMVKVNIINTQCINMSAAVTVLRLMMMTSIVSDQSLARDTHTHTHTHTLGVVNVKTCCKQKEADHPLHDDTRNAS